MSNNKLKQTIMLITTLMFASCIQNDLSSHDKWLNDKVEYIKTNLPNVINEIRKCDECVFYYNNPDNKIQSISDNKPILIIESIEAIKLIQTIEINKVNLWLGSNHSPGCSCIYNSYSGMHLRLYKQKELLAEMFSPDLIKIYLWYNWSGFDFECNILFLKYVVKLFKDKNVQMPIQITKSRANR